MLSGRRACIAIAVLTTFILIILSSANADLVPTTFGYPVIVGPGSTTNAFNQPSMANEQNPLKGLFNRFPSQNMLTTIDNQPYWSPITMGRMPWQFQTMTGLPLSDSLGPGIGYSGFTGSIYSLPTMLSDYANSMLPFPYTRLNRGYSF